MTSGCRGKTTNDTNQTNSPGTKSHRGTQIGTDLDIITDPLRGHDGDSRDDADSPVRSLNLADNSGYYGTEPIALARSTTANARTFDPVRHGWPRPSSPLDRRAQAPGGAGMHAGRAPARFSRDTAESQASA